MDYKHVSESPLNCSSAKQVYSFPRDRRFRDTSPELYFYVYHRTSRSGFYYEGKGALTDRSTTFGIGSRAGLDGKLFVPAPGSYNIESEFSLNKRKGYGFGHSKRMGFEAHKDTPGPGSYSARLKDSNLGISFGLKLGDSRRLKT